MRRSLRVSFVVRAVVMTLAAALATPGAACASSALDLVGRALSHEEAHEDDLALRRYTEALALDPTCAEAYLALARLRAKGGDLREAERVYDVALAHLPGLRAARVGRAHVRRARAATEGAVDDLLAGAEDDPAVLRTIATWHGEDGHTPAQLRLWRRIKAGAEERHDEALVREARAMIRALVILVGPADPAAQPSPGASPFRQLVATLARRGG